MNFATFDIVFQEVPGEITLSFTMTGCQLACKGCHSSYLWNPKNGNELTDAILVDTITRYAGLITTVLFLGGEWDEPRLIELLCLCEQHSLHTALYTGLTDVSCALRQHLTYLKVGPWIADLGGLNSPITNQTMIDLRTNEVLNHLFI